MPVCGLFTSLEDHREHAKPGEAVGANVIFEFELTENRCFSTDCAAVFPAESRDVTAKTFVSIRRLVPPPVLHALYS